MAFDSKRGTYGARQPRGWFLRLGNKVMTGRVRKGSRMMGFNVLVLHTVGRRSGVERANPVGWFAAPDGSKLIVASANGAADNPAWYYNLAAHPDVRIEVDGRAEE